MPPQIIVRIEVTKQAWDEIGRLTEKYGMTQLSMHSRMVEWLSTQPEHIRAAVLGRAAATTPDTGARLILNNMQQQ
jgi:hypothetical protein